jgi:hypothetical protein
MSDVKESGGEKCWEKSQRKNLKINSIIKKKKIKHKKY